MSGFDPIKLLLLLTSGVLFLLKQLSQLLNLITVIFVLQDQSFSLSLAASNQLFLLALPLFIISFVL